MQEVSFRSAEAIATVIVVAAMVEVTTMASQMVIRHHRHRHRTRKRKVPRRQ